MWDQTETRSSLNDNLCLSSSFTLQCFPHVIIGFSWENSLSTSINPSKTLLLGTPTQDNPKVAWFTSRSQVYVCFIPGPTAGLNHCLKWLAGIFCSLFSWREKFLVRQWCWQSYLTWNIFTLFTFQELTLSCYHVLQDPEPSISLTLTTLITTFVVFPVHLAVELTEAFPIVTFT